MFLKYGTHLPFKWALVFMVFAYLFTIAHQKLTQRCGKFDFNLIKKNIFMSSPQKLKEDSGLL